jgi:hypothetical protein
VWAGLHNVRPIMFSWFVYGYRWRAQINPPPLFINQIIFLLDFADTSSCICLDDCRISSYTIFIFGVIIT